MFSIFYLGPYRSEWADDAVKEDAFSQRFHDMPSQFEAICGYLGKPLDYETWVSNSKRQFEIDWERHLKRDETLSVYKEFSTDRTLEEDIARIESLDTFIRWACDPRRKDEAVS